jgi:hypothetical protein
MLDGEEESVKAVVLLTAHRCLGMVQYNACARNAWGYSCIPTYTFMV